MIATRLLVGSWVVISFLVGFGCVEASAGPYVDAWKADRDGYNAYYRALQQLPAPTDADKARLYEQKVLPAKIEASNLRAQAEADFWKKVDRGVAARLKASKASDILRRLALKGGGKAPPAGKTPAVDEKPIKKVKVEAAEDPGQVIDGSKVEGELKFESVPKPKVTSRVR